MAIQTSLPGAMAVDGAGLMVAVVAAALVTPVGVAGAMAEADLLTLAIEEVSPIGNPVSCFYHLTLLRFLSVPLLF